MNNSLKVQRCNFLPEGEMAIIKDSNTLIHNIVDSEIKQKNKEIERLNNIIDKAIKYIKIHTKIIPFNEIGEGGGLELTDYDIADLLKILGDKE